MKLRYIKENVGPTRFSLTIESTYDAAAMDAGTGKIRIYRATLSDQGGHAISSTSITVADQKPHVGYVADLKTALGHRGMGYASKLYREMLPDLRRMGIVELLSDTARKPQTTSIWRGLGASEYRAEHGVVFRLML